MAGGGGAWKVAYADFVTAMMAFFMVMWIVAQGKSVKSAVSGYFRDPFGSESKPAGSGHSPGFVPRRKAAGKNDPNTPPNGSSNPAIAVLPLGDGGDIGSPVLFREGSAELDEEGKALLKEMGAFLRGKENRVEIRGHTTRGPQRDAEAVHRELTLCYERCNVVMQFLEKEGVKPSRFRLSQASHFEPRTGSDNPLWRDRNSRVDVYLLSEYYDERKDQRYSTDDHGHHAEAGGGHGDDAHHGDGGGHAKPGGHDDAHAPAPAAKHDAAHGHGDAKHTEPKPADDAHPPAAHGHDPPKPPAAPTATTKPPVAPKVDPHGPAHDDHHAPVATPKPTATSTHAAPPAAKQPTTPADAHHATPSAPAPVAIGAPIASPTATGGHK